MEQLLTAKPNAKQESAQIETKHRIKNIIIEKQIQEAKNYMTTKVW